jgi:hypothetical protein
MTTRRYKPKPAATVTDEEEIVYFRLRRTVDAE